MQLGSSSALMPSYRDMHRRGSRHGLIAVVLAVVGLLAASSTAMAGQDELKGGSVLIQLHGSRGLKLSPGSLSLPITGGAGDPINGSRAGRGSGSFKAKRGKGKTKGTNTPPTPGANGGPGPPPPPKRQKKD